MAIRYLHKPDGRLDRTIIEGGSRVGIINEDGLCVNVMNWDPQDELLLKGKYLVPSDLIDSGDTYDFENDCIIRKCRLATDPVPEEGEQV